MWSTSRIWPWAFAAPLVHDDIVKASINSVLYAVDINLRSSGKNHSSLENIVNNELKQSSLGSCKQIMCQLFQQYQFFHISNQAISNQVP